MELYIDTDKIIAAYERHKDIGERMTKLAEEHSGENFDWRCYFCTTGVQVAISASVGAAFGALAAGGEIAAAAAAALSPAIAVILGMSVSATAQFILACMKNCSNPGALVADIANKACHC